MESELKNVEISESQCGQDLWVLRTLNYKKNGFFVDVGAAHYQKLNNTYYLEKEFEWDGICIEGNILFFDELMKNRKCKCINKYVSTDTNLTKVHHATTTPGDERDHGFGDFLQDYNTGITETIGYSLVKPALLMEILDECNAPQIIDYLSIDIEGADFPVLKTIDFNKHIFRTITIEDNTPAYTASIIHFLNNHGYVCIGKIAQTDLAFTHKEIK